MWKQEKNKILLNLSTKKADIHKNISSKFCYKRGLVLVLWLQFFEAIFQSIVVFVKWPLIEGQDEKES